LSKEGEKRLIPDPHGMIARIRAKLNPLCSVRNSKYCDVIIAMRMQGIAFMEIEKFLVSEGKQHRITASTVCRNLKATKMQVQLPYAEEIAEKWGGQIDLDLTREISLQIMNQRKRIDHMLRQEEGVQKTNPRYVDKRIAREMEVLTGFVKTLQAQLKDPMEAAKESVAAQDMLEQAGHVDVSEKGAEELTRMVLDGDITLGDPSDEDFLSTTH